MLLFTILFIFTILWTTCGVVASGFIFAWLQRKWPNVAKQDYDEDRRFALTTIPLGVISLTVSLYARNYKYGWKNPFTRCNQT